MSFPALDADLLKARLEPPRGCVRLVVDTDAANEIDDQYAIAWALLTPERMTVEAVTAEPFSFAHHLPELLAADAAIESGAEYDESRGAKYHGWASRLRAAGRKVADQHFAGPAEGMELSFLEICKIYDKLGMNHRGRAFRGATRYMTDLSDPVVTESAQVIVDLAKSGGGPLYIAAMGCVTNIAAALLMAPEIIRDIVVIWTSAYPSHAPHNLRPSLNLVQDVPSSRLLFDSGVPLVYLPGYHVGAQLKISRPEMESFVKGRGAIGDYLWQLFDDNPLHRARAVSDTQRRTWVIWDIIDIAWLINPDWVPTYLTPAPRLTDDLFWRQDDSRHLMREGYDVQRDDIFMHFYDKLAALQVDGAARPSAIS